MTAREYALTAALVIALAVMGALARLLAAARYAATHDPLTRLANRAALGEFWRRVTPSRFAVVVLDLDGFKPVNDRYGHAAGDEVLVTIANRLRELTRDFPDIGIVARLGGDEIAVVTLAGRRARVAANVAAAVVVPIELTTGELVRVTASIGVARVHPGATAYRAAMHAADRAMQRAKHGPRDQPAIENAAHSDYEQLDPARPQERQRDRRHARPAPADVLL